MPTVVTIAGSPSFPSRTSALLDFTRRLLTDAGIESYSIIVRDLPAEELLWGRYDSPALRPYFDQIAAANGVILASPVYKAAYSGTLKTFLDVLPQNALTGKVALPLMTGAAPIHLLALDYALKPVLSALGAGQIHPGLFLVDNQAQFHPETGLTLEAAAEERLRAAVAAFIAAL